MLFMSGEMLVPAHVPTGPSSPPARRRARVLLVDPHALTLWVAASWIQRSPDLEVCGTAAGVTHAFWAINHSRPDVIVSEILVLPDLDFIRELRQRHPRIPILVFSIQNPAHYQERILQAGASDYLPKLAGGEQLVRRVSQIWQAAQPTEAGGVATLSYD